MIRLGQVSHFSNNKHLIVRLETAIPPSSKSKVFNGEFNYIGDVLEVFGPLKSPYISIKPIESDPQRLVGKIVYTDKKEG